LIRRSSFRVFTVRVILGISLDLAESGAIKLAVSQPILDEVADVLQREKFGWAAAEVRYALKRITALADFIEPRQTVDVIKDDPSDNRILECVVAARRGA